VFILRYISPLSYVNLGAVGIWALYCEHLNIPIGIVSVTVSVIVMTVNLFTKKENPLVYLILALIHAAASCLTWVIFSAMMSV
nr:hypothetical protein [Clostridia bacterium]